MVHPDFSSQFNATNNTYFVVAKDFVPMGTITWVKDDFDRLFTELDLLFVHPKLTKVKDKHCFKNAFGTYVLAWDHRKYIAYNKQANISFTGLGFEVATKDIYPGSVVSYCNGFEKDFSTNIEAEDLKEVGIYAYKLNQPEIMASYWNKKLLSAVHQIRSVHQPLKELIAQPLWDFFDSIIFENPSNS